MLTILALTILGGLAVIAACLWIWIAVTGFDDEEGRRNG